VTVAVLELGAAARMLRQAVKDRSYRATPLGLEFAHYIRWKRNEWGATESTIRDYEAHLRNLALFFADLELADLQPPVGVERLRECMDHFWGNAEPRTRNKVRSTWVNFFDWAILEGRGIHGNPARAIARAKVRDTPIELLTETLIEKLLAANPYEADWLALNLLVRYGMRRGGIANVQMKHFDWDRHLLTVFTKGGRIHPLPIPEKHEAFWMKLLALKASGLGDDSFLLYKRDTRRMVVPLDQATEVLTMRTTGYVGGGTSRRRVKAGEQVGYADVTRISHDFPKALQGNSVHRWWYRCLENAGLVPKGTTAGLNMHRGRHTSITAVVRDSGIAVAKQLAGHADIASTDRYSHLQTGDLEAALVRIYGLGED
jgi:integrase